MSVLHVLENASPVPPVHISHSQYDLGIGVRADELLCKVGSRHVSDSLNTHVRALENSGVLSMGSVHLAMSQDPIELRAPRHIANAVAFRSKTV